MPEEFHPTFLFFLHALANFDNFPVSVGVHADRHQQGDLAHLATPGPFQPDAVQVQVGVRPLDRLVSLGLNLPVHLLVQLANRRGRDAGALQGFRDVLHPTDADPGQVHLDQGFLNTLNSRRLYRSMIWVSKGNVSRRGTCRVTSPALVCSLRL